MPTSIPNATVLLFAVCGMAKVVTASTFTPLPGFTEYPQSSRAASISADGASIAGSAPFLNPSNLRATIWNSQRQISALDPMPVDEEINRISVKISGLGSVVIGTKTLPNSSPLEQEGFRWTEGGGISSLGVFPGGIRNLSYASDLSEIGDIIVGAAISASGEQRAYRWMDQTGMTSLGTLQANGGGPSRAAGISADGMVIVGGASSELGYEPFRWTEAGMSGLGDLPGGEYGGYASDVSDDGDVVVGGAYSAASGASLEAFRWVEATGMQPLGFLDPSIPQSAAIFTSADGSCVFGYSGTAENARAFVWDQQHGMRDLEQILKSNFGLSDELTEWKLGLPADISEDGLTIIGNGINPVGVSQGWVITLDRPLNVPESTAAAMALATVLLSVLVRRPNKIRHPS